MSVHSMGLNMQHDNHFTIDRPEGTGDNLFLIFTTEGRVWVPNEEEKANPSLKASNAENGLFYKVEPGAFLLYTPGHKQLYGAQGKPYGNHYVHFEGFEEAYMRQLGIPMNVPAYLNNTKELETILRQLSREQISESPYKEQNENLLLELMLRKVSENQSDGQMQHGTKRHVEAFTALRSEMYATPSLYRSVEQLAAKVNMSLSHFQALYRSFFEVSCYEDLLAAKIASAKEFLINSDLSVREIAELCGYENDTCFMRYFKKRTGLTPTEYRRGD